MEHCAASSDPIAPEAYNATYLGGSSSTLATLTVPPGGIGLAAVMVESQDSTATWVTSSPSNITASGGDINNNISTTKIVAFSMAHTTTPGSWQPKVSGSPPYTGSPAFGAG